MSEIRIYKPPTKTNPNFEICGISEFVSEDNYCKYSNKIGSFNFIIPSLYIKSIEIEENYLVLINREFWGIIEEINKTADSSGHLVNVSGECLKGLLKKRITLPPTKDTSDLVGYDTCEGDTETVLKHFIENNIISPEDENRKIEGFVLSENKHLGNTEDKYMSRFEDLSEVAEKLCKDAAIGYDIIPNLKDGTFLFTVFKGDNRTAGQSDFPPITFSIERNTANYISKLNSIENYKNVFYSTKSGSEYENEAFTMTYYRNEDIPTGINRTEIHLNISAEHPEAGKEYEELKRLTEIEMKEYERIENYDVDVTNSPFVFERDYFLCDDITIYNLEFAFQASAKIIGIEKSHSSNSFETKLYFNEPKPSVFKRIKRDINNR